MTLRRRLLDWGLAGLFLFLPALVLRASLRSPERREPAPVFPGFRVGTSTALTWVPRLPEGAVEVRAAGGRRVPGAPADLPDPRRETR